MTSAKFFGDFMLNKVKLVFELYSDKKLKVLLRHSLFTFYLVSEPAPEMNPKSDPDP
jgi:hypothetical protein